MKLLHPLTVHVCMNGTYCIYYVSRLTCNCVQLHWGVLGLWVWRRLEDGHHPWRRDVGNLQGYCGLAEGTQIEDVLTLLRKTEEKSARSAMMQQQMCNKHLFPKINICSNICFNKTHSWNSDMFSLYHRLPSVIP